MGKAEVQLERRMESMVDLAVLERRALVVLGSKLERKPVEHKPVAAAGMP